MQGPKGPVPPYVQVQTRSCGPQAASPRYDPKLDAVAYSWSMFSSGSSIPFFIGYLPPRAAEEPVPGLNPSDCLGHVGHCGELMFAFGLSSCHMGKQYTWNAGWCLQYQLLSTAHALIIHDRQCKIAGQQ